MSPFVRIYNPTLNPRKRKPWTYDEAASRKDQAERYTRDVLEDDERADEIAAMSPENYAAERGKEINPTIGGGTMRKKVSAEEQARDNPVAAALQTATRAIDKQQDLYRRIRELEDEVRDRDVKLDAIEDVLECEGEDDCTAEDHLEEIDNIIGGEDEAEEEESTHHRRRR